MGVAMDMLRERVVPVVLSIAIIVLVAVIQERSRSLAAIIATVPLTAPLAMWIVFSATHGDHRQTAEFVGSMIVGFVGSLLFVFACWFALRRQWSFPLVLVFASTVWLVTVSLPGWAGRWLR